MNNNPLAVALSKRIRTYKKLMASYNKLTERFLSIPAPFPAQGNI